LLDVVSFEKNFRPGDLIRTGKVETEELKKYSERNSCDEKTAQEKLSSLVSLQRNARRVVKDWISCSHFLKLFSLNNDVSNLNIYV
jgi:hypothetical protein